MDVTRIKILLTMAFLLVLLAAQSAQAGSALGLN
jgi:hypothetical protein